MFRGNSSGWRLAGVLMFMVAAACGENGATAPANTKSGGEGGKASAGHGGRPPVGREKDGGSAGDGGTLEAGAAQSGGAREEGDGSALGTSKGGAGTRVTNGTGGRPLQGGSSAVSAAMGESGADESGAGAGAGESGAGESGAGESGAGENGAGENGAGGGAPDPGLVAGGGGMSSGGASGGGMSSGGASGGGAANGGAGAVSGTLEVSNLEVEPNPNMTISCFVSWTTDTPASSELEFGEQTYAFRIRDATAVTAHRVLVIGMHAETPYKLRAVSRNEQASASAETTFTTGALPADIPVPTLTASDFANSQLGWTLMNVEVGRTSTPKIVMYDENGLPVWYFIDGTHADQRGDISTELHGNSVLVGPAPQEPAREVDLSGAVLWQGPPNGDLTHEQTHGSSKTANGRYLLNIELDKAAQNGAVKIDDQLLEELTPSLDVVWSWKLFDHVRPVGSREELCHGNSLKLDETESVAYYNCRYLGLFKLERASGNILWRLGGSYDKTSLGPGDFTFSPAAAQFNNAHEPEMHADGTVLLYDNGAVNPTPPPGQTYHSRVVEYQLDETTMTATRTFEFPGDFSVDDWYANHWYTPIWGDADRLENGNILVTAGMRSPTLSTRVFEITRSGRVVWELTFPPNYGTFQAERVSPPLVEKL